MSSYSSPPNEPIGEINVTPLVDVLLVLLVVFMITSPLIHEAVPVDLPKGAYCQAGASPGEPWRVVITDTGGLFLNQKNMGHVDSVENLSELQEQLAAGVNTQGYGSIDVLADSQLPYHQLIPVILRIKDAGLNVNLVIEHQP